MVPIEIKSQLIDSALVSDVDVGQRELINSRNRLQIIKSNSKWDTMLVEDVDFDCPLEVAGDLADCMLALLGLFRATECDPFGYVKFNGGSSYKGSFRQG